MLILASSSPRRIDILHQMGYVFEIMPPDSDEEMDKCMTPAGNAQNLAKSKADDVFLKNPDSIVIGADTIVVIDNEILGKPKNSEEAKNMLKKLSGRTHKVITGVAIKSQTVDKCFFVETEIEFRKISEFEINAYVMTEEPFDKAGGYGIQGLGGLFVNKITGDFYNVVGLPIAELYRQLEQIDVLPAFLRLK